MNVPPTGQHSPERTPSPHTSRDNSSDEFSDKVTPLEKPAMPREVESSTIGKIVEIQPLLAWFLDHLLLVEGGRRGLKPSKEAQWRVGRLLSTKSMRQCLTNPNLLWNDDAMVQLRRTFIEGNQLLPKPRKVGTMRAYLTSLLMF